MSAIDEIKRSIMDYLNTIPGLSAVYLFGSVVNGKFSDKKVFY